MDVRLLKHKKDSGILYSQVNRFKSFLSKNKKTTSISSPAGLTFAGLAIAAQAEPRAAAAGPCLVTVSEQADIRAATGLSKLVQLAGVATHWRPQQQHKQQREGKYLHSVCMCVCERGHFVRVLCVAYLEAAVAGGRRAALRPCPHGSPPGSRCC